MMPRPTIEVIPGPLTSQMTRRQAMTALSRHPGISKQTSYSVEQIDGRWVAALVHQAGPPFGGPADDDEEAAGPKSEGPDDTQDSEGPDGPPSDGEDGPPKEKGGGDKELLHHLLDIVTQMATALGVPIDPGGSMVPGADDPGAPPGPPGLGGPPPGPPGGPDKTVHERAMKPGETPPGGTPLGAPAFASVAADHPWAHIIGKVASFHIEEPIGSTPLREVEATLQNVASGTGFKVKDFGEGIDDEGHRVAKAFLTVH